MNCTDVMMTTSCGGIVTREMSWLCYAICWGAMRRVGGNPIFRAGSQFLSTSQGRQSRHAGWDEARQLLDKPGNPLGSRKLDIVTFGTPGAERHGMQPAIGCWCISSTITPREVSQSTLVPFPPSVEQVTMAASGDMFQQLFIAGTNFPPNAIAWRSWIAERRLGKLLQAGHGQADLWKRLKAGMRCPEEGLSLLVNYAAGDDESARSMMGHAVYTMRLWLPFHLQTLAETCYA